MKLTYKVLRNDEGKIVDRGFIIEVENKGESEKLTKVFFQEYGKKYYTFKNKVTFICYDKTMITLKLFKAKITRLFIEADTMEVTPQKPIYTAKNTAKKVRRRNRQMVKAYNIGGRYKKNTCRYSVHHSFARLRYRKNHSDERIKQGKFSAYKEYFTPFYSVA